MESNMPKVCLAAMTAASLTFSGCSTPPQDVFWTELQALCGKAYGGTLTEGTAPGDSTFANNELIMHVRECAESEVRVPFHVGDDRSRTWIVTRTAEGLRLKHDHRREDGAPDEITMYGGDTRDEGTDAIQRFYADSHTADMVATAATNVWTIELVPGRYLSYGLIREGTDRKVTIEFDLSASVPPPPPPWGS